MAQRLDTLVRASPSLRRWRRLLRRHRRALSALLCALCLASGLRALEPPPAASAPVLVAAHDLAGGTVLTGSDVTLARWPPGDVPSGALAQDAAPGRTLAAPMRKGEPLTDVRLVGRGLAAALGRLDGQDLVETPVRLADPGVASLLEAGDAVDVLAAPADPGNGGGTGVVAADVRVLAVPSPDPDGSGVTQGALVVLATTRRVAAALAAAATSDRLSVTVLRG